MTKGAVETMSMTLANELGARGITVNAVAPGATRTATNGPSFETPGLAELIAGMTALNRLGGPDDWRHNPEPPRAGTIGAMSKAHRASGSRAVGAALATAVLILTVASAAAPAGGHAARLTSDASAFAGEPFGYSTNFADQGPVARVV